MYNGENDTAEKFLREDGIGYCCFGNIKEWVTCTNSSETTPSAYEEMRLIGVVHFTCVSA